MTNDEHTIVIQLKDKYYKVFKLVYGKDGSYYIMAPYSEASKATVMIQTVNYDIWRSINKL